MKSYVDYMKERGIPRGPWIVRERDSDTRPKDGDEGNTSAPLASSAVTRSGNRPKLRAIK